MKRALLFCALLLVPHFIFAHGGLRHLKGTIAKISPATYALRGIRHAILDGYGVSALWGDIWPLLVIGAVAVPLGLWVFSQGERYAKRHGRLKRSG